MPEIVTRAMQMVHEVDPKEQIWKEIGPLLDEVEIFAHDLLICPYVRPKRTISGLFLPENTQEQDKFQGIVGLVVKVGPDVQHDQNIDLMYAGKLPQINEWICFKGGDSWQFILGERMMRVLPATRVQMRITRPDIVI